MPIFRSARPCSRITAYDFQPDVLAGVLGSQEAGRVHCVHSAHGPKHVELMDY